MGTWDVGPFDNDAAADFSGTLDDAGAHARAGIVRDTLTGVIGTADYLDAHDAQAAVAAAALIAAQCPQGDPVRSAYGPEEPLPDLTDLRDLAVRALDRAMTKPSELLWLWDDAGGGDAWRARMRDLRKALGSPSQSDQS
ncbi:DUF4259 domain-containing protein [Streptomyces sp. bgisy022]|uniref:DUF4259 domain-containing protein n=1 Tax=Streptomyces sp. bgisy022 TaxID=3413769 RepID=UPI003D7541F9